MQGGGIAGSLSQYVGHRLTIMWVSLHASKPQIDLTWFVYSIFVLSSARSFRSGFSRIHSTSLPLALCASGLVLKGKSRKPVS